MAVYLIFHVIHGYINIWGSIKELKIRFAWDSTIDIIQAIGIAIFFLSFTPKGKLIKIINYIASHTFWIYLIHWAVVKKINRLGIKDWIYEKNGGAEANMIGEILYTVECIVVVFAICLIITVLLKFLIKMFDNGIKYIADMRKENITESNDSSGE